MVIKRYKLEMVRISTQDCTSIYSIINNTEETIIVQIKTSVTILEQKTGKHKTGYINNDL